MSIFFIREVDHRRHLDVVEFSRFRQSDKQVVFQEGAGYSDHLFQFPVSESQSVAIIDGKEAFDVFIYRVADDVVSVVFFQAVGVETQVSAVADD